MDNDFAADVRKAFYGLPEDVVLVKHSSICCAAAFETLFSSSRW